MDRTLVKRICWTTACLGLTASWVGCVDVTDDGTNKSVTFPATNSAQFFRLRRP